MKLECKLNNPHTVGDIIDNLSVATDMVTTLCGHYLGGGAFREVYEYNLDPRYVIKIEKGVYHCNLVEYMMYDEIKGLTNDLAWVKDWFAPVKWISPNGRILVMERTHPEPVLKKGQRKPKRPDKIPKFLWDVKEDNFGWIGKKFVCHDYGQFYNFISYPKTRQKAPWGIKQFDYETYNK